MAWVRIDDRFPRHPKVMRAAQILGKDGVARAMTLFLSSLCYSAEYLTDGRLPFAIIGSLRQVWNPLKVAEALADAGLFDRVEGGYQIHHYSDYNPSAAEVKADREWDRRRKELYADPELVRAIKTRDANRCRYCSVLVSWTDRRGPTGGQFDHIEPRGANTLENVVVACRRCNIKKNGRTPEQAGIELLPVPNQNGTSSEPALRVSATREGDGMGGSEDLEIQGSAEGKTPKPHPIRDVLTVYERLFEEKTGQMADIDRGKDTGILHTLITRHGVERVHENMRAMFATDDEFICRSGYSIGILKACFNKLSVLSRQPRAVSKHTRGMAAVADAFDNEKSS